MTADAKPAVVAPVAPAGVPEYLLPYFADIAKGEGLADNYRIEYVPGAKPGDGFMSELLAITLVGPPRPLPNAEPPKDGIEPAELRVPLVCKMQPNSAVRKEQSNNALMFEREVFVYNRLFPMFNRLQRSLGLNESNGGFFAMPKCYVAYMNVFNDEAFIIMQDLRHRGFEMLPKQKAVTFEHAKLLLQQLGRLHAMSFVLRDQRPDVFESFINIPDHYRHLIDSNSARSMFDSTFRRAERLLERPADRRLMAKLRAEWAPLMYAALDVKKMGKFAVFGHSDCWNNNMMFRTENVSVICVSLWLGSRSIIACLFAGRARRGVSARLAVRPPAVAGRRLHHVLVLVDGEGAARPALPRVSAHLLRQSGGAGAQVRQRSGQAVLH